MTLKDLAKLADVSVSTVSKALSNSNEIGDATKKRISELAKLYNYQPNNVAVNLKKGKTNTIGVIIPSIQNNFFAKVIVGIQDILYKNNYNFIISITHEVYEREANIIKTLSNGVVDGFIVALAEETQLIKDYHHYDYMFQKRKPLVLFDRVVEDFNCNTVVVDDKGIVYNAVSELIKKQRTAIALVSCIENLSVGASRKQGYLKAITSHQAPIIVEADSNSVEKKLETLFENSTIDAVVALDEDASLATLRVANIMQFNIPNQLEIIGFAPSKMAENLKPKLTTINQFGEHIGNTSAELLIQSLKNPNKKPNHITVNSTINHRETTKH